ncbi:MULTISPECIES: Rossmann-fold NAD(P)-binding domain-containing protein [Streptomyces]|uniref:FAD-dependent oxidoreductase n=1 Tax=Streptomyces TaxID=1883 RepID=UPI00069A7211|nr:FAD-dependent oxidoreductase [Streptomyces sp. SID7805]
MAYGAMAGRVAGERPAVLISGASVAGPALAYWLGRYGFRPTVVEVAPALRGGGFAVDFRGAAQLDVLARMGVLGEIRRSGTGGGPMHFIDDQGRQLASLPPEFAGGDVEILRSELSRILYERSLCGGGLYGHGLYEHGSCGRSLNEHGPYGAAAGAAAPGAPPVTEYLFGDSVTSLTESEDGVRVTFERGAPRTFDLVVGADGLHSTVRRLAFGPEERFVSHLGYYVAGWDLPAAAPGGGVPADGVPVDGMPGGGVRGLADRPVGYGEPGRLMSAGRTARRTGEAGYAGEAFCVFAAAELTYDRRAPTAQKKLIAQAYAGAGWRTPELIETLWGARDLYFDAISRVDVPRWSAGRTVLLGDAAYGATVGGMGTGSAIVGAYVLAGELAAAGGDHRAAFARYERRLRPYVTRCQEGGRGVGEFLAPATREAMAARNAALNDPVAVAAMLAQGQDLAADIVLEDYPARCGGVAPSVTDGGGSIRGA